MDAVTEKIIGSMKWVDYDVILLLKDMGCTVEPCGSRVTCNPPPKDTDIDFLVELDGFEVVTEPIVKLLRSAGFTFEGEAKYLHDSAEHEFTSWRRGDLNLIVTSDQQFATRHRLATYVCKQLNVMNKPNRITIFQAILYGNAYVDKMHDGVPANGDWTQLKEWIRQFKWRSVEKDNMEFEVKTTCWVKEELERFASQ